MKCPECDSQQPDNAATCSKCGLSFDVWREMNPIEASVQGEDMSFPETPDDSAPVSSPKETPGSGPAPEEPVQETEVGKAPKEKKPLPLGLVGGVAGGLVLIGILVFFLKKPSAPTVGVVPPVSTALASPVPTVFSTTPTSSPTSTPASAPVAAKPAHPTKPVAVEPTHTSTPKPQPTATFTPTDIPLEDKDTEKSNDNASVPGASDAASVEPTATHTADLLESSEPISTPIPAGSPAATSVP